MTIKAITFDFWQTLYQSRPIDFETRLRQMQADLVAGGQRHVTLAEIKAAVNAARDAWNHAWTVDHQTLSAAQWLAIMLDHLQISLEPAAQKKIEARMEQSVLLERPLLVDEARPVLKELSARYKLGLISDTGLTPGRVLRQILADDHIIDYFSQLTFSDEIGRSKPHPDAFLITLAALGAEPAQAVHVGDLLRTDIAGAQNIGMRGVQYTGISQDDWSMSLLSQPVNVTPDAVISNHHELKSLLYRWNGGPGGNP